MNSRRLEVDEQMKKMKKMDEQMNSRRLEVDHRIINRRRASSWQKQKLPAP
jgi:hypothetical protein